jgi:hypothetical protein
MGHLINPITFRVGRSTFWNSNFVTKNKLILKKRNFLYKFILKLLYWLFNEKFSLSFFYNRFKLHRRNTYLLLQNNLKSLFINKYYHMFKLCKLLLFMNNNNNFIFKIYMKNPNIINFLGYKIYFYVKLYFKKIHYISKLFAISGLKKFDDTDVLFFIEYFRNYPEKLDYIIQLINKISKYKSIKAFNKNDLNFFDFSIYIYLLKFLKSNLEKKVKKNLKKKKFSLKSIFNRLIFRILNVKTYINLLDTFAMRLPRNELRFFKLEVTNVQLFFSSNQIKINIITFKENTLKNFYLLLQKNIHRYLSYRWNFKRKLLIKKRLNFLIKLFIHFNKNCFFLSKTDLNKLFSFMLIQFKKLMYSLKKFKKKTIYFFNIFFYKLGLIYHFKHKDFFLMKKFNTLLLNSLNFSIYKKLLSNLFFNYQCNLQFIFLENTILNAFVIFKFIHKQLSLNKPINRIMKVVYNELLRYKLYKGFKILLRGRFTRKERAFNRVWYYGKVPLSTIVLPIDYYASFYTSKFGIGSIRVWLFKE